MVDQDVGSDPQQAEVDRNFTAFMGLLPELMTREPGRFALMHDGEVIEFFDSMRDAVLFGSREYPDSRFSVQEVAQRVVDLGYFSHALHHDPV